ncbi:DUF3383 family protein [Clostridium haemolyticum]|uniref:DUF3383 family protein n=1 Tax=Clostridium haemolyticum NCTC 9693 TaxID=1443114 RepID=A0ABR4THX3_CLOHA|nr:DUF3383 family protein [Clostridium haemolyticum]KEI18251.1 hypothetical protein Z960_03795 [Clostridium haemolyticum NCTC 9693]KGN04174.1 hypothetical protein Z961_04285 [Clostridium haemolyticum NCTC 8350]
MSSDIKVDITDASKAISIAGFGLTLVIATNKDYKYKEFDISEDISEVKKDFDTETEIYKIVETLASQEPRPDTVAIFGKNLSSSMKKATDLKDALNTLIAEHNDFYRILLDDKTEELIKVVSDFAEGNEKTFYTVVKENLKGDFSGKNRTCIQFKKDKSDERLDAATVGYATTRTAGSFTFKFKHLNNITADVLTNTELTKIRKSNMNAYVKKYGIAQLDDGKMASGIYIDQIESRDYIKNQIEYEIANVLMNSDKIPYTDNGIQKIVSAVKTALNRAFDKGIIAETSEGTGDFKIDYKTVDKISEQNRKARILTGITFKYVEAGAIHGTVVNGSVVMNL